MHEVKITDLQPDVFYLAKERNGEYRFQGTFETIHQPSPTSILFAQLRDTKDCGGNCMDKLYLSDHEFIFFEKDAEIKAYTNVVLRKIIGDPDFSY